MYNERYPIFLVEYASINSIVDNFILKGLNEAQLRQAPAPGQNSLAWLLWLVARSEDFAVRAAAAACTRAVVTDLNPAQLEEMANVAHFQANCADGVSGSERARCRSRFFANHTQAWWLGFINWHGAEHLLGEAFYVCSQNGIPVGV